MTSLAAGGFMRCCVFHFGAFAAPAVLLFYRTPSRSPDLDRVSLPVHCRSGVSSIPDVLTTIFALLQPGCRVLALGTADAPAGRAQAAEPCRCVAYLRKCTVD